MREAGYILRTFAHYVRDGLIPNMFPDGQREGLYHTADATLWFFHAIERYTVATGDDETLRKLLPVLLDIIAASPARHALRHPHRSGRRPVHAGRRGLPAHVDGREGRRLGRDAAPRQGRRAECALVQRAVPDADLDAGSTAAATGSNLAEHAARARESFNARFWYEKGGYLYDVVDGEHGDDPCLPPEPGLRDLAAASRCSIASAGSR